MKKDAYENSKLKYQLLEKKRNSVGVLIWKLNSNQVEYIRERFGFSVEPYLYAVTTRKFKNLKGLEKILRDIHYGYKEGKRQMIFKLNDKEKEILDEFGVKYRPFKYKIKLRD